MDETDTCTAEAGSLALGEKRPLEPLGEQDDVRSGLGNKKVRREEVGKLKEVAEIVMVLATLGEMRGGRKPTAVEVKMMAEAREKLVEICAGVAPKDVFPTGAFGKVIEDLGLGRLKEAKTGGFVPPKISIVQKMEITKQKMEKAEAFKLHSATYAPRATDSPATPHAVQTPISSRNLSAVHASAASNSRSLSYQLPTSEVRPLGSNVPASSHLARGSTASPVEPAGRPAWSMQSQSAKANKGGLNNGSAHLTNINHHRQHHMNSVQATAANTHNEVAKIVQKVLQQYIRDRGVWNPPSRDYMSKRLACQTCKIMINEVNTVLICDACEKGYHLKCLPGNLKSIFGNECHEWHCAKCLLISNGKPLPLKYGRVMRNITTQKKSATEPSLEKKVQSSDESFSQRLMSANGDPGSQTSTDMQISGSHDSGNRQDANVGSKPSTDNGINIGSNPNGENGVNEASNIIIPKKEASNIVETSELCTTAREDESPLPSSMNDVEWVGGVINESDGKMYYGSCCVSGTTYKLQDYALFRSTGIKLMPNKLQSMWEDSKTNKKWVTVTHCFFPDGLPEGVGRPCAPESNEVYESNHETTLAAGLIHGPCKVFPPKKFSEETMIQTHSQEKTVDKQPEQIFLCKWFYDEKKRHFRDVAY